MASRKRMRPEWIAVGALLLSYAWFFQGGGWNPNSRLDLTRALVERGTLAIDAYARNTEDWARHEGRTYTNKAPGLSFAAAPAYAATRALTRDPLDEGRALAAAGYVANLCVNAIPAALLGLVLCSTLARLGVGTPRSRAALTLAYGLGTLAFPYATAFYAHQPAAVAGFCSFAAWLRGAGSRAWAGAAGTASGAAVTLEASSAIVPAALGLALLADPARRRELAWFVLGGLPFAAALGAYHHAAFGDALSAPFAHQNPRVEVRVGGALFGVPPLERVASLLAGPKRGLLFTSPLLLLAPFGLRALHRADRHAAWVCGGIAFAGFALVASFHAWRGGWAPGPRYLVPFLPFLFLPTAFALARGGALRSGLAALSIASMLAITAVGVEVPGRYRAPLFDFALARLWRGEVSVNGQGLDDPLPPPRRAPPNHASFNLGEGLLPHSPASVLPLLAAWALLGRALYGLSEKDEA